MEKLKKFLDHEQATVVALIIIAGLFAFFVGCESKVASIKSPELKVDRATFNMEVEQELDRIALIAKTGNLDLDRQDAIKQGIAEVGLTLASGGTVNPVGIATTLFATLGVGGLVIDNRRKDTVIKTLKNNKGA